ncbi:MAG: amidohydrolase [Alicyclobacillus macrosporangiidus]|uniref:amidohydrolase family protein n=1 Tax=Alicyclobacillus macrosporangiidus TaxID=392015 RepID=UPI0026E9DDD8|nr:amidohydrolase family protein [Alicyclobacillus macrosporangiidus]MCL6598150.1 amidohydrolase [Alicyclobacillus macrosporangiidus]
MFDVHTHFVPPEVLDWVKSNRAHLRANWDQRDPAKAEFLTVNGKWSFELKPEFYTPELYLDAQAQAGVTVSLVSPIPQLFLYEFDPGVTAEMCALYNRALANWVQQHPNRLRGLGTVPLNDPEQSASVLLEAMRLGLKGAIIGPGFGESLLSHEKFRPFWEAADVQHAVLFIHPLLNEDPRLRSKMMPNLIGVPWETTIAATDLVLSGWLDKFPNVHVLLAHGGGFLPYQLGRLQQGYNVWTNVFANLQAEPRHYLRRFWYDNVLLSEEALLFLQSLVGPDRVLPGSDFPFDLKAWPPARAHGLEQSFPGF